MSISSICNSTITRRQAFVCEPTPHFHGTTGYFFIGQKFPEESPAWKQRAFRLRDLAPILGTFYADPSALGFRPNCDSYISQSTFTTGKNRLAANVDRVSSVWLELDTVEKAGLDPVEAWPLIEARRVELGLPPFSCVNFSGAGLHCYYYLTDPATKAEFAVWRELIERLAAGFEAYGVDRTVFDLARVLRLPRTLNTYAGVECRTLAYSGDRYDLADLHALTAPLAAAAEAAANTPKATPTRHLKIVEPKTTRAAIQRPALPHPTPKLRLYKNPRVDWSAAAWTRIVYADLERLMDLRFEGGILPPGERDELLFPAFVYLAGCYQGDHAGFVAAARELCRRRCAWSEAAFLNCIGSLAKRHRMDCDGVPAPEAFVCHVYTFKAATLIKRLAITAEEQVYMQGLVNDSGRRERDRLRKQAARRAAGAAERADYLDAVASRREQAQQLHQDGRSIEGIAEVLGVSKRSVYAYIGEARAVVQSSSAYSVGEQGGELAVEVLQGAASDSQAQESGQPAFLPPLESPAQEEASAIIETGDHAAGSFQQASGITPPAVVDELAEAADYWAEIARRCYFEQQAERAAAEAWGDVWEEMEAIIDGRSSGAGAA